MVYLITDETHSKRLLGVHSSEKAIIGCFNRVICGTGPRNTALLSHTHYDKIRKFRKVIF